MKKIVLALLMVICASFAYASAPPDAPPPSTFSISDDGQVTVNVIRKLSIRTVCPCDVIPPEIIAGTSLDLTDDQITANFEITGQPDASIIISVNGKDTLDPYTKVYESAGVLLIGRWGSFLNGHVKLTNSLGDFTSGLPVEIVGLTSPTVDATKVHCNYLVDKLVAHADAPPDGSAVFVLQVWAEYNF